MRAWLRRTVELQRELAAIAEPDRRWWLLAGAVALAEPHARGEAYLACDAEPDADTFMGYRAPRPRDVVADAIARAHAARTALRELDGQLPEQPLAVTVDRARGACTRPSRLDVAAFAIGDRCVIARLDDPTLAAQLVAALAGGAPRPWQGAAPFVAVAIGDEPIETARHGHRRAWTARGGPWLGLGRAGELAVVSTCHLIVDGYGHAYLTARIAALTAQTEAGRAGELPTLSRVAGAVPLTITWRPLPGPPLRVVPLAYELGCLLHRHAPRSPRFSPTIQIPVARGRKDDPARLRRRVVSTTTSVRFEHDGPEPFAAFEARVRGVFAREAADRGLASRLLAAARAVPVPVAWKRQGLSAKRPGWMEDFAEVIAGRALLSRIAMDLPMPAMCAVSSPSRMASASDPVGGCVISLVDDHRHGAITLCGSGAIGAAAILDELLAASSPALQATAK